VTRTGYVVTVTALLINVPTAVMALKITAKNVMTETTITMMAAAMIVQSLDAAMALLIRASSVILQVLFLIRTCRTTSAETIAPTAAMVSRTMVKNATLMILKHQRIAIQAVNWNPSVVTAK
jgi:hypothetical protein